MYERFLRPGPLDITRLQNEDASKLDQRVGLKNFRVSESFAEEVSEVGESFSFLHRDVIAFGEVLQKVPPQPGKSGYLRATGDIHIEAQGTYRGLMIIDARDEKDQPAKRVVHVLEKEASEFRDEYYRRHSVVDYSFVCAEHSSIFPLDPVNAHSNVELKDDIGTANLLRIIYGLEEGYQEEVETPESDQAGEQVDPIHTWSDLGWEMNQLLTRGDNGKRLNHQRVSLLNMINPFEGSKIYAADYIIGNPKAGDSLTKFTLSDPSEGEKEISIGEFAIFKNYFRPDGDNMGMVVRAQKELYVRGLLVPESYAPAPASPVVVAVKNVVGIA